MITYADWNNSFKFKTAVEDRMKGFDVHKYTILSKNGQSSFYLQYRERDYNLCDLRS